MDYDVIKQHYGDQQYVDGDVRHVANKNDAKQLIDLGLIAEIDESKPRTKQAKTPANKMAKEPENKAE